MLEEDGQYVCGTLEYLSPDVVRNKKYDSYTDLWSLGVLMFEMLSGRVNIILNLIAFKYAYRVHLQIGIENFCFTRLCIKKLMLITYRIKMHKI
jgi:serine/threonine protein kinase